MCCREGMKKPSKKRSGLRPDFSSSEEEDENAEGRMDLPSSQTSRNRSERHPYQNPVLSKPRPRPSIFDCNSKPYKGGKVLPWEPDIDQQLAVGIDLEPSDIDLDLEAQDSNGNGIEEIEESLQKKRKTVKAGVSSGKRKKKNDGTKKVVEEAKGQETQAEPTGESQLRPTSPLFLVRSRSPHPVASPDLYTEDHWGNYEYKMNTNDQEEIPFGNGSKPVIREQIEFDKKGKGKNFLFFSSNNVSPATSPTRQLYDLPAHDLLNSPYHSTPNNHSTISSDGPGQSKLIAFCFKPQKALKSSSSSRITAEANVITNQTESDSHLNNDDKPQDYPPRNDSLASLFKNLDDMMEEFVVVPDAK
jgi:hypothetical protein